MARRPLIACRGTIARFVAVVVAVLCAWEPAAGQSSIEYELKAAFLYKFAPFVTWPPPVQSSPAIWLCVIGDDPFGPMLERAVAGQRVGDKAIELKRYASAADATACHIAYLSGSPVQSVADALALLRGQPVLTVTDSSRSPAVAGIVHFVIRQNRLRFEVDDRMAAESRLNLSSKLLSLASAVKARD